MEIDNSIAVLMLMYMLFVFIVCWICESRRAQKRAQEEAEMRGDET